MLGRVLDDYLRVYRRATQLIKIFREGNVVKIEVPYQYLFEKPVSDTVRIVINLNTLIEGSALGKIYRAHSKIISEKPELLELVQETR